MKKELKYVLYFHTDHCGEVFYVGIGGIRRPTSTHHRNRLWWNIVKKRGIDILVVEQGLSWEEAQNRERYWIKYHGRRDLGVGSLVNMTDGGDGAKGLKWTEDRRKKASEAFAGNRNPFYGKKHLPEALAKNTAYHTGVKQSQETIGKRSAALTGVARPGPVRRRISASHKGKRKEANESLNKMRSKIRSKLTEEDVRNIRRMSDELSYREIGSKYGMACSAISKIINKQSFTHVL